MMSPPLGLGLSAECFENFNTDHRTSQDPFGLDRYSFPVLEKPSLNDQGNNLIQHRVECEIPSPSSTFENPIVRQSGYQFRKVSAVLEASEARRFQSDQDSDRSSSPSGYFPMRTMRSYTPTKYRRSELMEAGFDDVASSSPDSLDKAEPASWDSAEVNLAAFRFGGPSASARARCHTHSPMPVSVNPDRETGSPLDWVNVTSPPLTPSACSSSDYSFPSEEDVNNARTTPITGLEKHSEDAIRTNANSDLPVNTCSSRSTASPTPEILMTTQDSEKPKRSRSQKIFITGARKEKDQVHEPRPKTLSVTNLPKKLSFRNLLPRKISQRTNLPSKLDEDTVEELEQTSHSQTPLKESELKALPCKAKDQVPDDSSCDLRAPIHKTSKARLSLYGPVSNFMGTLASRKSGEYDSKPSSRETSHTFDKPLRTHFQQPLQTERTKDSNDRRFRRAGLMRRSKSMIFKAPVQLDQPPHSSLRSSQSGSTTSDPPRTDSPNKVVSKSKLRFWRRTKDSSISSEASTGTRSTRSEMGRISGPISIRLMTDDEVNAMFGMTEEMTPQQDQRRSRRGSDSSANHSFVAGLTEPVRYNSPPPLKSPEHDIQIDDQRRSVTPQYPTDSIGSTPRAHSSSSSVPISGPYSTLSKPPRPPRLRPVMSSGVN